MARWIGARLGRALFVILATVANAWCADDLDAIQFDANEKLAQQVVEYSEQLVRFAKQEYTIELDGSEASIRSIDEIFSKLHTSYVEAKPVPAEATIKPIAQAGGSYIGEVYRRHHGGTWGWITDGEKTFAGLRTENGRLIWPWARALARIKTGEEMSLSAYYDEVISASAE